MAESAGGTLRFCTQEYFRTSTVVLTLVCVCDVMEYNTSPCAISWSKGGQASSCGSYGAACTGWLLRTRASRLAGAVPLVLLSCPHRFTGTEQVGCTDPKVVWFKQKSQQALLDLPHWILNWQSPLWRVSEDEWWIFCILGKNPLTPELSESAPVLVGRLYSFIPWCAACSLPVTFTSTHLTASVLHLLILLFSVCMCVSRGINTEVGGQWELFSLSTMWVLG